MDRQKELQQDILWLREKLEAIGEPELPLVLSGELLKQRAQAKPRAGFSPWRKLLPLTCALVFVAAVGLWSSFSSWKSSDNMVENTNLAAEPKMAAYSVESAPAAFALTAEDASVAGATAKETTERSVTVSTYKAEDNSREELRTLYPAIEFYTLNEDGESWTVLCLRGFDGERAVAVLANEAEVYNETDYEVVRDSNTGKELRFDALTLEWIE